MRDARLSRPVGLVNISVSAGSPFVGLDDAREVVDFGVAMLDFPRDESGAKNVSIVNYLSLVDWFYVR